MWSRVPSLSRIIFTSTFPNTPFVLSPHHLGDGLSVGAGIVELHSARIVVDADRQKIKIGQSFLAGDLIDFDRRGKPAADRRFGLDVQHMLAGSQRHLPLALDFAQFRLGERHDAALAEIRTPVNEQPKGADRMIAGALRGGRHLERFFLDSRFGFQLLRGRDLDNRWNDLGQVNDADLLFGLLDRQREGGANSPLARNRFLITFG